MKLFPIIFHHLGQGQILLNLVEFPPYNVFLPSITRMSAFMKRDSEICVMGC